MGTHTSHDPSSREVLDSLRRIVQALRESSRRAEQQLGIGGAQLFVLEKLAEAPSQSLNELAARTHTHQSSVSTVVARLVEQRLVSREHAAGDSRRVELVLTARGRRLAAQTTGAAQKHLIASIQRMPPRSRRQLAVLLGRVVREMKTTERRPPMFFHEDQTRSARRNVQTR
jgi:MarR family transcriptional regulator, lower aerobic nicotinate degradation pathway regulator